jgi:hypothetical protein
MYLRHVLAWLVCGVCRLDPVICKAKATGGAVAEATIKAREMELLPAYQQMALRFADMHDTPQRM